jgi:hypothetical protein
VGTGVAGSMQMKRLGAEVVSDAQAAVIHERLKKRIAELRPSPLSQIWL